MVKKENVEVGKKNRKSGNAEEWWNGAMAMHSREKTKGVRLRNFCKKEVAKRGNIEVSN
jgi:hypothetical protein